MSDDGLPPFYRDHYNQSQRRRAEALLLVKHLWPHLSPDVTLNVAQWVYRGEAKVVTK